jgi:hypothetical protein
VAEKPICKKKYYFKIKILEKYEICNWRFCRRHLAAAPVVVHRAIISTYTLGAKGSGDGKRDVGNGKREKVDGHSNRYNVVASSGVVRCCQIY